VTLLARADEALRAAKARGATGSKWRRRLAIPAEV
jgi:hypothetical protein